jgi:hypothetical protein
MTRLYRGIAAMIFALIVGFLASAFYVTALRVFHLQSAAKR